MTRPFLRPWTFFSGVRHDSAGMNACTLRRYWLSLLVVLAATLHASPTRAEVDLRVEATPVSEPIQVFVTVNDANGDPVGGLTASDFTLKVDGAVVQSASFTLPPDQDPSQKISVVFVMDFSGSVQNAALIPMQNAVMAFINAMRPGDYAAIIKFNGSNPAKASVVQPFTEIDGGAGTSALIAAVMAPYSGNRTNLLDGVDLGIDQFVEAAASAPLPAGPKAVILVSDGADNASETTHAAVLDKAAANSIPIFTIGVADIHPMLMTDLAVQTGGTYLAAPSDAEIEAAYAGIAERLNNEYLLTITSSISDCNDHTIEVSVSGIATPVTATFARCVAPGNGTDDEDDDSGADDGGSGTGGSDSGGTGGTGSGTGGTDSGSGTGSGSGGTGSGGSGATASGGGGGGGGAAGVIDLFAVLAALAISQRRLRRSSRSKAQ
jgi:VWFA-related protein